MPWVIDTAHSHITFSVRHMMVSNARGEFQRFSGTVDFNEQSLTASSVEVQIDAASINTNDERRDEHLRAADFFNSAEYPVITFKSTRVEQISDSEAHLIGDLTIRDITKPVTLNVEYAGQSKNPWGVTVAGFSATTKINRKEWGLTWNATLETGGILVGDDVKISLEIELTKQVPAPAATEEPAAVA